MKKVDMKELSLTLLLFAIIACVTGYYYHLLPDNVAVHFNINSQPDGYMTKFIAFILSPLLLLVLHIVLFIFYDLKGLGNTPVIHVAKWTIPVIGLILQLSILLFNLGIEIDYRKMVVTLLGVLYIIIGNYLPKDGIENMSNETERRGRKQAGYLFIIGGLLLLVSLLGSPTLSILVLILFGISVITLSLYYFYRRYKTAS
ncbi:DUF1648 domain-containing protein [Streptococcus suis]|uniref:Integral membrane protein n=1 Tax=Streptococcus suis TaxID=1307 RepID=A0A116QQB4_STRSU|nr:DUF1648 domain-containing protein [Streptococcus suis]NQN58714.1 DUF1648 domain-containing protein [Streptococcus suis]NQP75820.1 DUF1648 domain-containing protein [Streptococcus suis]NQP77848.1 DUF1648 domain-containing protein [Streptococcus suis]NQP92151.1 DUF1648 domain-containing protein [Streptococcus suis]NQP94142.1 DUF1648 domain-containing protein [Streptococcus suis]